nr:reverse transcriptase domain-containing protein [Tanacetum cinerariifolium]
HSNRRRIANIVESEIRTITEIVPMADRTMEELLQAPTEGDVVSKTDYRIDKLADQILNLVEIVNKQVIAPAKAVEKTCVTCRWAHAYYECIATDSNPSSVCVATSSYTQVSPPNRASHQIRPPGFAPVQNNPNRFNQNQVPNNQIPPSVPNEFSNYIKSNEIAIKSKQNQIIVLRDDFNKQEENIRRNLKDDMSSILSSFFQNQPSNSGTLSSNIVPNPKGEMKAVTTHSGLACEGPSIPTESPLEKVDEQNTEEILDKEHSNSLGSTAQVQPSVVPISILEPNVLTTQKKPTIPYPSRVNDQKLREKATNQMEKIFQIFHDLHFDISFADALLLMPKFASIIKSLLANKDKLFELAKVPDVVVDFEADLRVPLILGRSFLRTGRALIDVYGEEITLRVNDESMTFNLNQVMRYFDNSVSRVNVINIAFDDFVQDVLDFQYNPKSSCPTLVSDDLISESDSCKEPIDKSSKPTLTLFEESDFFSEEIENFLKDDLISMEIENSVFDPEGDILYIEKLLNKDLCQLPPMNLNQVKSPIEEPEYSLSMGYEHFITTPVTELDEVTVSSAKNLVPFPSEYEVTSDNESEYEVPINDASSLTFTNPLFNDKDNFTIHDEDVPIEESKVYSNPIFDDDEINSNKLESHCLNVESNFVESLSNHDTLKFDCLKEFFEALMPIRIADEERIGREHAEYISIMERLITINPCPLPIENANTIVESLPSSLIPIQDNDSQREEINIVTNTDYVLNIPSPIPKMTFLTMRHLILMIRRFHNLLRNRRMQR